MTQPGEAAAVAGDDITEILQRERPYLRERYGVERLAVYGSVARGQQTGASDVDIVVELARPLGLDFVGLARRLEEVLGREVDLTTFQTLEESLANPRLQRIASEIKETLVYV